MIFLKELYQNLPVTLKKQISIHAGIALFSIFLFFVVLIFSKDLVLAFPCIMLAVFMIVKSGILFYNCITENYLEITGICSDVETNGFRKRIRSITIESEQKRLKILIHYKLKNINIGDRLTVYMAKKTQLYYKDGDYIAADFYGIAGEKGD